MATQEITFPCCVQCSDTFVQFGGCPEPGAIREFGGLQMGLTYMNARFYAPTAHRFLTPDVIVPAPTNPQDYNRYAYTRNNPLKYRDPSGHAYCDVDGNCQNDPVIGRPAPPGNPWVLTDDMLDLNGDGRITWKEEQEARLYYSSQADSIFANSLTSPVRGDNIDYGGYGGCRTRDYGTVPRCAEHHPAVDTSGTTDDGATVYATTYGTVVYAGWENGVENNGNLGYIVIIEHDVYGVKYYSIYAHLEADSASALTVGQRVGPQTAIGVVGRTGGNANNPVHLHFEVRREGYVHLGPAPYSHSYYWGQSAADMDTRWFNLANSDLFEAHEDFNYWVEQ